ncbi:ABC transporter, ATP-binding/permease protein [Pedobacter sp. BAL39]|nr:ABC transporter, ATP-binding/permease protein [Pedobacter sp. BAL39]
MAALVWLSDKKNTLINLCLQAALSFFPVVTLYLIKTLIENLTSGKAELGHIFQLIIMFGITQLLLAIFTQFSTYIGTIHQQKLTDHLSGEVLTKAISVDYSYYENPTYHDNLHLAQQQSVHKATQLLSNFNSLLLNSCSLVMLVILFFSMNSLFGLLFMGLSIPLAAIKWYSGMMFLRLEKRFVPAEREASYLHQVITGVNYAKEVRIFGFGKIFIDKYNKIRSYIHDEKKKLHLKLTIFSVLAETFEVVAMVVIFGLLAEQTWQGQVSIGLFVLYLQGFQRLQTTSRGFLQSLVNIFQQRIFLKDLFTFLALPAITKNKGMNFPLSGSGLEIKDVSFTYPETENQILHQVSMRCKQGEIIAIVGENGSGKSTLVKLLARLYANQTGEITIGGLPISGIDDDSFHKNSIFLFQDFEKYFFSVEENIKLATAHEEITGDRMINAARLSGAHDFITGLKNGYQTRMGRIFDGSSQLSGGQWQKLALTRAFYKDAKLIILDEPSSALDPQSEFDLFRNIKTIAKEKVIIMVSHRLYNLKMADRIYVMDKGSVVEEGSFEELIQHNGTFKKLFELQRL